MKLTGKLPAVCYLSHHTRINFFLAVIAVLFVNSQAANCGQSDILLDLSDRDRNGDGIVDGTDVGLNAGDTPVLTMNECVSDTFFVNGVSKTLTVYYTTTQGLTLDKLMPVTTRDGIELTAQNMAEEVLMWNTDAWKQIGNRFGDPLSSSNFNVVIFDENDAGRCCNELLLFNTIRAQDLTVALQRDPRSARWIAYHYFWLSVNFSRSYGSWINDGQATWAEDKIDLSLDNSVFTRSISGGKGYIEFVREYFELGYLRSLTDLDSAACVFWTYFTEQAGSTEEEPGRGIDTMEALWINGFAGDVFIKMESILPVGLSFETFFANFGTANYAKNYASVPNEFRFLDSEQLLAAGINYPDIGTQDIILTNGVQGPSDVGLSMPPWSNRYYKFIPGDTVSNINLGFRQDTNSRIAYTLLVIKNNAFYTHYRIDGEKNFEQQLRNENYDEVVLIMTSFNQFVNYRYVVNAINPVLEIIEPSTALNVGIPEFPSKFLLKVQVYDPLDPTGGIGNPIIGLTQAQFKISVGSIDVVNVIAFEYILGQYWLQVIAPEQAPGVASIAQDLTVSYDLLQLSDTKEDVIVYNEKPTSDNVMATDMSGSMGGAKIDAAKVAAKFYVDSFQQLDQLAIVSYNSTAFVDVTLNSYGSAREMAMTKIDLYTAGGGTSIGNGLLEALDQLSQRFPSGAIYNRPWVIVLLSDGLNNNNVPDIADFSNEVDRRRNSANPCSPNDTSGCVDNIVVHTVAIGSDANRIDLKELADSYGGTYHFAAEPSASRLRGRNLDIAVTSNDLLFELSDIYRYIYEIGADFYQIASKRGTLIQCDDENAEEFEIDEDASDATFVLLSNSYYINARLFDPMGNDVGGPTVELRGNHMYWRILSPAAGTWTMVISEYYEYVGRRSLQEGNEQYLAEASVVSDLTLETSTTLVGPSLVSVPVQIICILSSQAALPGQTVTGYVVNQEGEEIPLKFFDDGLHGDGSSDDGIYGAQFPETNIPGSYTYYVEAFGSGFARKSRGSFVVEKGVDTDGDGMSDYYEEKFSCLDAQANDAFLDADNDGLPNIGEMNIGTDPCDSDSDNSGENDGSELLAGQNPLDGSDDQVRCSGIFQATNILSTQEATDICTSPQASVLKFSVDSNISKVIIWRRSSENEALVLLDDSVDPTSGMYIDNNIVLGERYCYQMAGENSSGSRSCIVESCTTPLAEPLCVQSVVINNNDDVTEFPAVTITSVASGAVRMRLSNTFSFQNTIWIAFSETTNWTLESSSAGIKNVYVMYEGADGSISTKLASILYVGDGTSVCDFINPCQDLGNICVHNGDGTTSCQQPQPTDPCDSNPCQSDETCIDNGGGGFSCQIPAVDPCSPNPCNSGETCVDIGGGAHRCDIVDICNPNPCQNPASICVDNSDGTNECEEPPVVTPCDSNPCQSIEVCTDNSDGTFNCGTGSNSAVPPCDANPCQTNEVCVNNSDGTTFNCNPSNANTEANPCDANPCTTDETCFITVAGNAQCIENECGCSFWEIIIRLLLSWNLGLLFGWEFCSPC